MSGTTLDAALTALTATYTAAAVAPWVVVDGRPYDPPERFLAVGWNPNNPAASGVRAIADMGMSRNSENYQVACLLSAFAGDELTPALRGEVCQAFDLFDAALAANRTLGGVVAKAWLSQFDYLPNFAAEGAFGQIHFAVTIAAWQ